MKHVSFAAATCRGLKEAGVAAVRLLFGKIGPAGVLLIEEENPALAEV